MTSWSCCFLKTPQVLVWVWASPCSTDGPFNTVVRSLYPCTPSAGCGPSQASTSLTFSVPQWDKTFSASSTSIANMQQFLRINSQNCCTKSAFTGQVTWRKFKKVSFPFCCSTLFAKNTCTWRSVSAVWGVLGHLSKCGTCAVRRTGVINQRDQWEYNRVVERQQVVGP